MPKIILRAVAFALCLAMVCAPMAHCSQPSLPALALEQTLKAPSAIMMDAGTGTILLSRNAHETRAIASVTKIMTMLLIMEALDEGKIQWDDKVRTSAHAASYGGSQIWLEEGETLTVEELFLAVAMESANDCAVALAEFMAGSEVGFVALMNERARALGMQNTNFTSACGLDIGTPYSSAYDVALMSRELLKHKKVHEYVTIRLHSLKRARTTTTLTNTNRDLLANYAGYDGLKTGWTNKSGYCLSSTAKRGDLRLIAVVLGAATPADRKSDIVKLLDYGYANYEGRRIVEAGQKVDVARVDKGRALEVSAIAKADLDVLLRKGAKAKLERRIEMFPVAAPVKASQVIGRLSVLQDGNELASVDLIASVNVDKAPLWLNFKRLWKHLVR